MEKKIKKIITIYKRSETRESDSFDKEYYIFINGINGKMDIKKNKVTSYFPTLVRDKEYTIYLDIYSFAGIETEQGIVFNWGGRIIKRNPQGLFTELNHSTKKKPLTEKQLIEYYNKFISRINTTN